MRINGWNLVPRLYFVSIWFTELGQVTPTIRKNGWSPFFVCKYHMETNENWVLLHKPTGLMKTTSSRGTLVQVVGKEKESWSWHTDGSRQGMVGFGRTDYWRPAVPWRVWCNGFIVTKLGSYLCYIPRDVESTRWKIICTRCIDRTCRWPHDTIRQRSPHLFLWP